jgi:acyl dehydratase
VTAAPSGASKDWQGRFFEDLEVGDRFRSRIGRTITEADNVWFTCLTHNTNQIHFNDVYAAELPYDRALVNSTLTLALVTGLTVPDVSENAVANLSWTDIVLPRPVFVGDTLWAETEVLTLRLSESRPELGIVGVRSRGINQRDEVVIQFTRSFMLKRRSQRHETVFASIPWLD